MNDDVTIDGDGLAGYDKEFDVELLEKQSEAFLNTRELDRRDRCDRCGAEAYVRAYKGSDELLFCGHHGMKHLSKLIENHWGIQDERYRINAKPMSGSKD